MKQNKKKTVFICLILLLLVFTTNVYADNINCSDWDKALNDLENLFKFLKIIIPLLIIGLSSYEFIKAVTAKDDKNLKKAFQRLGKRLVLAIVFFFLPTIIKVFLLIAGIDSKVCIGTGEE